MSSFRAEIHYNAPPPHVYAALAAPGGDNGWWSTAGDVMGELGSHLRLNWSPNDFTIFRIDDAQSPEHMAWTCVAQHDTNLPRVDEWVNSTLLFTLESAGCCGTMLHFEHRGLVRQLDCYDICESGWDFFLRRSVRRLAELGKGLPFQAAAAARERVGVDQTWAGVPGKPPVIAPLYPSPTPGAEPAE